MDRRGRITVPLVMQLLMAVAAVGALYPVFWTLFNERVGEMSTGTAYLWQLVLPFIALVMLTVIFRSAIGGGA